MQKPTSMMVTGVLNIVFASAGALMAVVGVLVAFLPLPGMAQARAVYEDDTFLLTVVVLGGVGLLSKLAMGVSGAGLVRGQAWGRSLGNIWAVFSMVYGLVSVVLQGTYILPKTLAAQQAAMQGQPGAAAQQQMMQGIEDVTFVLTLVMGVLYALVYQGVFLFLNNRQVVRDYLAQEG